MDIREIEKIIDSYHSNHSFLSGNKEQLIFELLSTFQEQCLITSLMGAHNPMILKGISSEMDSLNQALIWVEQSDIPSSEAPIKTDISEERSAQCLSFLTEYALPYSIICSGYISYTRKRMEAEIDGTTVIFKNCPDCNDTAWNDIIRESNDLDLSAFMRDYNPIKIVQANEKLLEKTNIQDGYICYELNADTLEPFLQIAEKQWDVTKTLPDSWRFDRFTMEEYKKVWVNITAVCYIHFMCCFNIKDPLIRLKNEIINISAETFILAISKLCGVDDEIVKTIINYITFDPTRKNVDIMYQPIVVFHNKTILITPMLFMGSRPERNLLAVVSSRKDYNHSKEVNDLEDLMEKEIEKSLPENEKLQIIKHKNLGGRLPDIDFGIYDKQTQSVLICELKWFMAADSTKEVYAREDEITHGCDQVEQIITYAMSDKGRFMKQVFGLDNCSEIDLFYCVVAKHNIRTQNNCIPVINMTKLKQLFSTKPANIVFHTIRNHEYEDSMPPNAEITYQSVDYGGFTFKIPAIRFDSVEI